MFFAISPPDEKFDVLETMVDVSSMESSLEQFTIEFSKDSTAVNMDLMWDKTMVSISLN